MKRGRYSLAAAIRLSRLREAEVSGADADGRNLNKNMSSQSVTSALVDINLRIEEGEFVCLLVQSDAKVDAAQDHCRLIRLPRAGLRSTASRDGPADARSCSRIMRCFLDDRAGQRRMGSRGAQLPVAERR